MGKEFKNIVFDLGGVLISYRNEDLLEEVGVIGKEAERIIKEVIWDQYGIWEARDRGKIGNREMLGRYAEAFPYDFEAIRYFIEHEDRGVEDNTATWNIVHFLKKSGYNIYLLSNYAEEPFMKQAANRSFMDDVDGGIISYMTGFLKPEQEIYKKLLNTYHLDPSETLFFDDLEKNVASAEKIGISAIQVTSQDQLRSNLKRLIQVNEYKVVCAAG